MFQENRINALLVQERYQQCFQPQTNSELSKSPFRKKLENITNIKIGDYKNSKIDNILQKTKKRILDKNAQNTPKKSQNVPSCSSPIKTPYQHVCINHPEQKAKYYVQDRLMSKYCYECAIKVAPDQNQPLQKIEKNKEKENFMTPFVTPFNMDQYYNQSQNRENSIVTYNSEVQNFMIDLEQVLQTNSNAQRDIQQEKQSMKEIYQNQKQKINNIYSDAIKLLESQRFLANKQLQDQYTQNIKIFSQIEENIYDNQKETEKIQMDLHLNLDDNAHQDSQQQVLDFYRKRLNAIEDYISQVQKMTFSIDKVRPNMLTNIYNLQKEHFYLIKDKNVEMSFESQNSVYSNTLKSTSQKCKITFSPVKGTLRQKIIFQPVIQISQNKCQNEQVYSPNFKPI